MVKDQEKKWVRPKAKFKVTAVGKTESKPWKCPTCGRRFKTQTALTSDVKSHPSKKPLSTDLAPSARQGFALPSSLKKSKNKTTRNEALKKGRKKGQKAQTRVRDVGEMEKGIQEYERALEGGETAAEYKQRIGINKQKICHWRKAVKKARKLESD